MYKREDNYRSINKIEYDICSDKFEMTSNAYIFNKDSNATMLDLFNKILFDSYIFNNMTSKKCLNSIDTDFGRKESCPRI